MKKTQYCIVIAAFILLAFTADRNRSNYLIPRAAWSVVADDLDLDGDMDIVVGHIYNVFTEWSGVSYLQNDGSGMYNLIDSIFLYAGQTSIKTVNVDNQSYPEIMGIHLSNDSMFFAKLSFDRYCYSSDLYYISEYISAYDFGDINGDAFSDIVFYSNSPPFWGVMLNDGTGAFLEPIYYTVENSIPSGIECGDIDGNGRDDIVLCGQTIEIFMNYESGFEDVVLQSGTYKSDAFIVDFDDDGDNDILTFAGLPVSITQMYENTEDNLDTIPEHYFYALSKEFFVSDFNNDNFPDIIYLLSSEPGCVIWYNGGGFKLIDSTYISLQDFDYGTMRGIYCKDLDGNNYNDILITHCSHIEIPLNLTILFNDGNGHFVDDPVGVNEDDYISEFESAMICYPNPFSEELNIQIFHDSDVIGVLKIFDLQGRVVYEEEEGLNQELRWNGLDIGGHECEEGVYVVQLVMDGMVTDLTKIIKY